MKIKVLHIINSMLPGGAEVLLANSLAPGGLCEHTENHLAYFMGDSSYLLQRIDQKVQLHFLDYKGGLDIYRLIRDIKKIITDNHIDIVHSHLNPSSFYTHLACPAGIAHVHTMHTTYSMDKETSPLKLLLEKNLYLKKKSCNLILLSDFTKEDFLRAVPFKGKAFVLNNFVPDEFFKPLPATRSFDATRLYLIAIGRLNDVKNFNYLLEVFTHLKDQEIYLDIFGEGNKEPFEEVIQSRGLKIRMMGHSATISEQIRNYDLFIMPSKFEGFPLSVFEAIAAGVPAMLSDIAPLRSILKGHALYFELNNPQKVAGTLTQILHDRLPVIEMAVAAKIYAEQTVRRNTYIHKLLAIYDQLLGEKTKG